MRIFNSRLPDIPAVHSRSCTKNNRTVRSSRRDIVLRLSSHTTCRVLDNPAVRHIETDRACWVNDSHLSRRHILAISGVAGVKCLFPETGKASALTQDYENKIRGYRLSVPSEWEKVDKAGADALFRDPGKKSTNVGVTVFPVTVKSLQDFGGMVDVRDKLLAAEKAKDGFLDVSLLSEKRKEGREGALLYVYSYEVYTTRGRKQIVTGVTIQNSNLFIVNGMCKCSKDGGCTNAEVQEAIKLLEACVDSFDVFA